MSRTRFRRIFKKKGIRYGHPKVIYDRALERQDKLDEQKKLFANQLN